MSVIRKTGRLLAVSLIAGLAAGCASVPSAPPTPTASSVSTPTSPPLPSTSQAPSPEEAAWAKVVADAKKEGRLTYYATSAYAADDAQVLIGAFYQKYGIKVDFVVGQGATNIERLKTEKRMGQVTGDVVSGSVGHLTNMKRLGILGRVADLPGIRDKALWEVDPLVIDPDGYIAAYQGTWTYPLINTKLVPKGTEPKLLSDLLKPEWKGKVLFVNPLLSTVSTIYYLAFIKRGLLDWSYVEALGKQVGGWSTGSLDTPRLIAKGDYPIANWASSGSVAPLVLEGAPIKALSMEEGDAYQVTAVGLVEGAPHPNAAKVFLNWMYSKEYALLATEKTKVMAGYESMLKGVPSSIPELAIPPLKKRITFSQEEYEDGTKLFAEQYVAKLFKLK